MARLHPTEEVWTEYCLTNVDLKKIPTLVDDPDLLAIGKFTKIEEYIDKIEKHCKTTTDVEQRAWHSRAETGAIGKAKQACRDGKLCLAVAHACKQASISTSTSTSTSTSATISVPVLVPALVLVQH